MSAVDTFTGFPAAGLQFLRDLRDNNNRDWFQSHRADYERDVQAPAQDFVVALGTRLQALDPAIRIDTRTNGQGTLMRIHRDVRFSEDKSPYKTAVAGMFWDGAGKKTGRPAFGFHLEPERLELMAGMFQFDKAQLETYRRAVAGDVGEALAQALAAVKAAGPYTLVGEHFKRVPAGFDPDHPRADLLRYNGLYAHPDGGLTGDLTAPGLVDAAFAALRDMAPVYEWLKRVL